MQKSDQSFAFMKSGTEKDYQVIIIGGGAAGLAAGLWSAELGLKALILESAEEPGGQLLWTHNKIKNHLGVEAENGREMQKIFLHQIEPFPIEIKNNCLVSRIDVGNKTVKIDGETEISAEALVIATGIRRRKLGLKNEDIFLNKGIIISGKGEGEKTRGKKVCIVGGGDAALENALILSEYAEEVTLIHRRREFRGRTEFIERVRQNPKVKILTETTVAGISGSEFLESLELQVREATIVCPTDYLLLRLGVEPNTELIEDQISLDKNGYCLIDSNCETNVRNVFAIGDVANPLSPTISSAVGMGATAAKTILKNLSGRSK